MKDLYAPEGVTETERNTKFINSEGKIWKRNVVLVGRIIVQVVGILLSELHIAHAILVCRIFRDVERFKKFNENH